jgi:hypothetical protein
MRQWRGTPAEETTDRETVVETYLKKLEWAGIEIHRRRYRNNVSTDHGGTKLPYLAVIIRSPPFPADEAADQKLTTDRTHPGRRPVDGCELQPPAGE